MRLDFWKLLTAGASAAAIATVLTMASPANAATVYDNLGSSQDGSDPVFGYGPLANSFMTHAGAGFLTGFQALLKNGSSSVAGDIQVSLHANSANAPGAALISLGSLSSASVSTAAFAAYAFAPVTTFLLSANTMYWLEIEASTPNAIEWSWSNDLLAPGVAGQLNYSAALGTNANSSFGPYQMSVTVAAVPEPSLMVLTSLGLGLTMVLSSRRRRRG